MVKPLPSKQVSSVRFRLAAPSFPTPSALLVAGFGKLARKRFTPRLPEEVVLFDPEEAIAGRLVHDAPDIGVAGPGASHRTIKNQNRFRRRLARRRAQAIKKKFMPGSRGEEDAAALDRM